MADIAPRDENRVSCLMATSNVDGTPVKVYADPVTHRLLTSFPSGTGDVVGPSGATDGDVALFDGATGKKIKDGGPVPAGGFAGITALNGKQDALGFTPENVSNKSTSVSTDGSSDIKYPSVKAVKDYADGLVVGLLDYRGAYDASGNAFPTTGGSGAAGAVLKGDMWIISVAGNLGGTAVQIGDSIIANVDTPGQTAGNWNILNGNISYVPEDVANKVTSLSGSSTDTQYPSAKLVYDQLALKASIDSPVFTTKIQAPNIELGDASDTTITRSSAGVIAVEGNNVLTANTGLPLTGGTMSGDITLGENASIALDPAGSADGKYTGITIAGVSGYSQEFGDLVYLDPTDSRWELADANVASGADGDPRGILAMVVSAGTDGNACKLLLHGVIRADAKFPTMTVNNPCYISETPGAITQTQPTTADVVIRIVGFALTADEIYFNPENSYITHT